MQYLRHYSLETMFFLLKASMEKLRSEGWGQTQVLKDTQETMQKL